jgi:hypothetical protein
VSHPRADNAEPAFLIDHANEGNNVWVLNDLKNRGLFQEPLVNAESMLVNYPVITYSLGSVKSAVIKSEILDRDLLCAIEPVLYLR